MDPFWLTFTSATLEEQYMQQMAGRQPYPIDASYWCFCIIVRVAAVARFGGWLGILNCWPAMLYLVWTEVALLTRWSVAPRRWCQWRTNLVVASRMLHCLEISTGSAVFVSAFMTFGNDQAPTHPLLVSLSFSMVLGMNTMICHGLFLPLSFRVHLPLQLGVSVFLLSTVGPEICRQTGGETLPGTDWVFKVLDALALQQARILVGNVSRMDISWAVEFPCLHMAMFALVYIGFGVISYIVWLFERQSRFAFIEALRTEEGCNTLVKPLHWLNYFAHLSVFFMAFGALWIGFLFVSPKMMS